MPYIIGIIILVITAIGFALSKPDNTITADQTAIATKETVTDVTTEIVATTSVIADGAHTTSVTYLTPAHDEYKLDVTVTTENGIITDANVIYSQGAEKDPNPQRFDQAYKEVIIGAPIENLELSRVGGASLTTAAFNQALENIRTEA